MSMFVRVAANTINVSRKDPNLTKKSVDHRPGGFEMVQNEHTLFWAGSILFIVHRRADPRT